MIDIGGEYMKRIQFLFIGMALVLSITLIIQADAFGQSSNVRCGTIYLTRGQVSVFDEGSNGRPLAYTGQVIMANQLLQTGENAMAVVTLNNGSRLNVYQNSIIQLKIRTVSGNGNNDQISVGVLSGQARILAQSSEYTQNMAVSTPSSVAGVRGTDFSVGVGDTGSSNMAVTHGMLAMHGSDGNYDDTYIGEGNAGITPINRGVNSSYYPDTIANGNSSGPGTLFPNSDSVQNFIGYEYQEALEHPHSTINDLLIRIRNMKRDFPVLINRINTLTDDINGQYMMGARQLNIRLIDEVKKVDAEINNIKMQPEGIVNLAHYISTRNPYDSTIQYKTRQIEQLAEEIEDLIPSLDRYIEQLEYEIYRMETPIYMQGSNPLLNN